MLVPASRAISRSDAPSTPSARKRARAASHDARLDVAARARHQSSFFRKRSEENDDERDEDAREPDELGAQRRRSGSP